MHIPDGYLSPESCGVLGASMVPAWAIASRRVRRVVRSRHVALAGQAGSTRAASAPSVVTGVASPRTRRPRSSWWSGSVSRCAASARCEPASARDHHAMTGAPTDRSATAESAPDGRRTGDRLGVRWGFAGGTALASIDEAREVARYAVVAGFDGLWISHANAVDPIVALAAVAADTDGLVEVGTSVVPIYGRHPIGVAQLARTAQSTLGGRFTLGIGAASLGAVSTSMGLAWEHPLQYTREFIAGLQPLLAGRPAAVDGTQVTTHAELNITAPDTPILLAALGPRMLELAGSTVQGTTVGQCGPRTIASYIAPGAERRRRGGRPSGAADHGAHPVVRHRRPGWRVPARPGDRAALPQRALVRRRAGSWRDSTILPSCT